MKKAATYLIAVLLISGIASCKKAKDDVNKATEFDMNYSTQVTVPKTSTYTVTQPVDFETPEISTQSSNRFASESTTQDLIDEIKITKFNISNPNGNLDFLKSISIYIKSSGMGDLLIATKSNIPAGTTSIAADLTDANIKQYIFKEKIKFKVSLTITTGTSSDQTLKVDETVHVKGKRV
jgi:hypothetical protein